MAPRQDRPILGRDSQSTDTTIDTITEEELLRGLGRLTPVQPQAGPGG